MTKLYFLLFVWGPALLGFSLGWLVRHPSDWTGPAVMGPVGAVLSVATFRWGIKRQRTLTDQTRTLFLGGMIAAALVGVVVFGMLALSVI